MICRISWKYLNLIYDLYWFNYFQTQSNPSCSEPQCLYITNTVTILHQSLLESNLKPSLASLYTRSSAESLFISIMHVPNCKALAIICAKMSKVYSFTQQWQNPNCWAYSSSFFLFSKQVFEPNSSLKMNKMVFFCWFANDTIKYKLILHFIFSTLRDH